MLSAREKRFIRYWDEQRKGGRWAYYALYILAGTFIATIVLYFLLHMMSIEFLEKLWLVPTASCLVIAISIVITWSVNEKRFKAIIRREVENGKAEDGKKD